MWLLVITLRQMYNDKKQAGQREIQNVQFEKRSTSKCNGVKSSDQGDKRLKEKSDVKWNKRSGEFRTRPYPAKLPICKRELEESLSSK